MPASEDPSTDVAVSDDRSPAEKLIATVRMPRFKAELEAALPPNVPAERFVRIALTALYENPDVASADPFTVRTALFKAAADGLMPDGREAALVVDKNRKVRYMPMIAGLRKIAADHGWSLRTAVVYNGDAFDYELGAEPTVRHKRRALGSEREDIVAAYAVARRHAGGATELLVMERPELDKIRAKAQTQIVWNEWPAAMYEKTVGRQLFKQLPLGDSELVRRVVDAGELEPGEAEALLYGSPGGGESPIPAGAAESLLGGATGEEPGAAEPPAPAPFTGEEPDDSEAELVVEELEQARAVVLGFGKHEGETLGDLEAAGNKQYLRWLASDAVEDEDVRKAAARVLARLR